MWTKSNSPALRPVGGAPDDGGEPENVPYYHPEVQSAVDG